ncbi:MAG: hypothetical protein RBR15_12870 [Sphaerochaeta sp.]|nr:hypothetical protein [Sphaerochaeta sp.]
MKKDGKNVDIPQNKAYHRALSAQKATYNQNSDQKRTTMPFPIYNKEEETPYPAYSCKHGCSHATLIHYFSRNSPKRQEISM